MIMNKYIHQNICYLNQAKSQNDLKMACLRVNVFYYFKICLNYIRYSNFKQLSIIKQLIQQFKHMDINKKGIRLKHKENFVDGIVNFFKRDSTTPQKVVNENLDSHSPRSVSPAANRKKIFKKSNLDGSFQDQAINLQNNYEITFNQNQRNKNIKTAGHMLTGKKPIHQIHHQQSQIARLILDTSKNNNDPYRQTSMTSYKNPLQRPIYPSNQSVINSNHHQNQFQNKGFQQGQKIRQMSRQIQYKNKEISQLKQEVFNLKQHKQLAIMQIRSLKQQVHRLERMNKILQQNQYKGQSYLIQKQKQTVNNQSDYAQRNKQKTTFNTKDSLPILPDVASEFRINQRSRIFQMEVQQNSIRSINLKKSDPRIKILPENRMHHETQNAEEIVSPFMAISTYQKTVKPKYQQMPESNFKKQNKFIGDEGRISKTVGRFSNLQPEQQVKGQKKYGRQNQLIFESGNSGKYSQTLLSYSEQSKQSQNSHSQFKNNSQGRQTRKQKQAQQKSLRINDSKIFNFQDFDGGESFQQVGYF